MAALLASRPRASAAEQRRIRREVKQSYGGPTMRYDRLGMYNLSRKPEKMTLRRAIDDLYGTPAHDMLHALVEPTHAALVATLQASGKIRNVLGGLGAAKHAVELQWLGRIPLDTLGAGGPGYRTEIDDILHSLGLVGVRSISACTISSWSCHLVVACAATLAATHLRSLMLR